MVEVEEELVVMFEILVVHEEELEELHLYLKLEGLLVLDKEMHEVIIDGLVSHMLLVEVEVLDDLE
jgi:hypothetical protein